MSDRARANQERLLRDAMRDLIVYRDRYADVEDGTVRADPVMWEVANYLDSAFDLLDEAVRTLEEAAANDGSGAQGAGDQSPESVPLCTNCGTVIRWSLDFRRWVHDQGGVRYCVANFTPIGTPTTEAEPAHIDGPGASHG